MPHLSLRQTLGQKNLFTPKLRQALEILHLSHTDLEIYLQQHIADNPFLELKKQNEEPISSLPHTSPLSWNDIKAVDQDLHSFLSDQVRAQFSENEKKIALRILEDINLSGYFEGNLSLIARECSYSLREVTQLFEAMQKFEPSGVCARDLRECLILQAKDRYLYHGPLVRVLDNLSLFASGKIKSLQDKVNLSSHELGKLMKLIQTFDPKPGLSFAQAARSSPAPEVLIIENENTKKLDVILNPRTEIKLFFDESYYKKLLNQAQTKEEHRYFNTVNRSAKWLFSSLKKRSHTLLQVARAIVDHQQDFFRLGPAFLRPLALHDVAKIVGLHESTISRVTHMRYIETPKGLFDMKYFFKSHATGLENEQLSAESVRFRIQEMVRDEHIDAPLSDIKIVENLRQEHIFIARRTVTKYREHLKIPPAFERKRRQKQLELTNSSYPASHVS